MSKTKWASPKAPPSSSVVVPSAKPVQSGQKLFTVADAAIRLGRTQKAIRRMYESGKITPVRIDGRVQFKVDELDALVEAAFQRSH